MSTWYRRNARMRKGHKEYTKCGFENAKKNFIADDLDVDCSESHYLITGANRGIGLETALEIARRGGVVHLLCRNRALMLEARSHIITTTGNDRLHLHTLDLSRPRDVGRWAQDFVSTHERLDVLIHNAGTMNNDRTVDEDGIETTFAVNTLSVHLLTIILLPLLQRSQEPRVITVSSSDLLQVKLDSDDLYFGKMDPFDGYLAYAQTKRQQVVMNVCYAQRYEKVRFYSMHPGWVDTKILKKTQPGFYSLMQHLLRTPEQGADTIVWLAVSLAAMKHTSGTFFQDRHPVSQHLPLAWTKQTPAEERSFMQNLDQQLALVSSYSHTFEDSSESGFDESSSNEIPVNNASQSWENTPNATASRSSEVNDIASHTDQPVVAFTNRNNCSMKQKENNHSVKDDPLAVKTYSSVYISELSDGIENAVNSNVVGNNSAHLLISANECLISNSQDDQETLGELILGGLNHLEDEL